MALHDAQRTQLLSAWRNLAQALLTLAQRIQHERDLPAWAAPQILPDWASALRGSSDLLGPPDRDICIAVLTRLEFLDEQPSSETLVLPGLLGASLDTLTSARQVNKAKDDFKAAVLALRRLNIDVDHDPAINAALQQDLAGRVPLVGTALRRSGLARLALKQCYRHIPVLTERPRSLRWTWARTRAITRITTQEAQLLLNQLGSGPNIDLQLLRLASIPATEVLARVQDCAPHLRANVVFAATVRDGAPSRRMINAPVPVLYPAEAGEALPKGCEHLKLGAERKKPERKRRNDQKLEDEPFLPAIRAYRYLR